MAHIYFTPAEEDVPEIAAEFTQKLDSLMNDCPGEYSESLAAWAYLTELALHPFTDANNRGSWATGEYVRYVEAKKHGKNYTPLPIPRSGEIETNEVVTEMSRLLFDMNLFPNPYYEMAGVGGPMIAVVVNREKYFDDVRTMQLAAIRDITIDKLVENSRLKDFAGRLKDLSLAKSFVTKPLDATEMAEKFKANLSLR